MATTIELPKDTIAKIGGKDSKLYLTQAGALALATPCAMKDYISNNRRDKNGRSYLTTGTQKDDTNISVQFVCLSKDISSAMSTFEGLFSNGKGKINGIDVLYKSIGSVSQQGAAVVFSANLIKLAPIN